MIVARYLVPLATVVVAAFGSYSFMRSAGPDYASADKPAQSSSSDIRAGSGDSLLRPEHFAKVLAKIRKDFGSEAKLVNFRIEASRADVQVPSGGKTNLLQFNANGDQVSSIDTGTDISSNPNQASITEISAGTPQRIMKKVAKRSGTSVDNLSYMVLSTFGEGKVGWYVSLETGEATTFYARLDGSGVRAS